MSQVVFGSLHCRPELHAASRVQLGEAILANQIRVTSFEIGGLIVDSATDQAIAVLTYVDPRFVQLMPLAGKDSMNTFNSQPVPPPEQLVSLPLRRRRNSGEYASAVRMALRRARFDQTLSPTERAAADGFLRNATSAEWDEVTGAAQDISEADPGMPPPGAEVGEPDRPRIFQRLLALLWEHRKEILALILQIAGAVSSGKFLLVAADELKGQPGMTTPG